MSLIPAFWQSFVFLKLKSSWTSRISLGKWQMMKKKVMKMKILAVLYSARPLLMLIDLTLKRHVQLVYLKDHLANMYSVHFEYICKVVSNLDLIESMMNFENRLEKNKTKKCNYFFFWFSSTKCIS